MFVIGTLDWVHYMFMIPLALLSVFLILVILVQRGRGGGLTGALGGMGGQSAFGTKAGDMFTRITIVIAAIWILLSMTSLKVLGDRSASAGLAPGARGRPAAVTPGSAIPGKTAPGEVPAEGGVALPPGTAEPAATPPAGEPAPTTTPPASPPPPAATPPAGGEAPAAEPKGEAAKP